MAFRYETRYCTFILRQIPTGEWGIFVNDDMCYSACTTIEAAIDDIQSGITGCEEWNMQGRFEEDVPDDIREWERIR